MRFRVLGFAVLMAISVPVLARHCPADMKQIDAFLATKPSISDDDLAAVMKLRAEGEELHNAGKHSKSEDKLDQALKILKLR